MVGGLLCAQRPTAGAVGGVGGVRPERLRRKVRRAGKNSGKIEGCGEEHGSSEREGMLSSGILGLIRGQEGPSLGSGRTCCSSGVGKMLRNQGKFLSHQTLSGWV